MQTTTPRGGRRNLSWLAAGAAVTALAVASGSGAYAAGGGTAKGGGTAANPPQVVIKAPPPINWSGPTTNAINIHSFDVTGFIEDATVSNAACPSVTDPHLYGGTALVNGQTITIPCNLIMQMPASTWTWADLFDPVTNPEPLTLNSTAPRTFRYPSTEIEITGNIINGQHIAGLILMSQQSLNLGTGVISAIDYSTGTIQVKTGATGTGLALLQINDPNGRFGLARSPDQRFSVDDENPTIHAETGYPMCVPRTDPASADDPLCPQRNRPKVNPSAAFFGCRSFQSPGVNVTFPGGMTFAPPVPGQVYCSAFVMKDPKDPTLLPSEPDAMQQAPFEVGDFIQWQGTLLQDGSGIISVHTIEAKLGIFTQPGSLPAYVAIGEFEISSDADFLATTSIAGTPQEVADRMVLEAMVTDPTSVADIYLVDKDPITGVEYNRWITTEAMTGGVVPGTPLPILVSCGTGCLTPSTVNAGGITTQFTGPLPGRIRLRATKAPTGLLVSPTRNVRVALRSLCTPDAFDLDPATGLPDPTKPSINYKKVVVNGVTTIVQTPNINVNFAVHGTGRPGDGATCLQSFPAANGLFAGQYLAPEFTYIFPENVVPGDPIVPYDFWNIGFLVNGEGPGTGALLPPPW